METVFHLNVAELNINFLEILKLFFGAEREVEIAVRPTKNSTKRETRTEYFMRLEKAKENIEKGNVIRFTPKELNEFAKKLKRK